MKNRHADVAADVSPPRSALRFVILLGLTSLFADMTYEGARSITGPYLSLRLVSGFITDRTGRYWMITLLGYVVNLFAVPLLALAGHWPMAALLIIMERLGKAVRTPARDTMLSHATQEMGRG
jgi:hypothetical protein